MVPSPRWFPEWGGGHPGHCSVLVSISGLHLLSISGIYPPVVTMTGVPRPSLQELLPDELMHMVQRDLLPPGLGQVSQRARESRGGWGWYPTAKSPCHGHKLPTPDSKPPEQTKTAEGSQEGQSLLPSGERT